MIKRAILLSALCAAGSAWAQQSLDISEKDLASGAANARLSALARTAASSGKRVVVTAPQHLHAQVAAALAAGGKADVVLRDGFYENVLVRVEDKAEEAPKPAAAPAPAPAPPPAPAVARPAPTAPPARVSTPPPAPVRTPPPVAESRTPPPPPAPVVQTPASAAPAAAVPPRDSTPPPPPPQAQPSQAATPAPAQEPTETAPAPTSAATNVLVASVPGEGTEVRSVLESNHNSGAPIRESLTVAQLINGDTINVSDGAAVVMRRDGTLLLRYWLVGEIDLEDRGLRATGENRYRVVRSLVR